jgi:putative transposase
MTLPRPVVPGCFYMITRRCTQRQFLMRPDEETNNAFTYCLAEAAGRFGIDVILPVAMSNHHHTVIYDRLGTVPQFTEHFHKMFAKCQNALRGRWENFWASQQVSVVRLVGLEAVMAKLVYAATNPVKDGLVENVHEWPGVNGLGALLSQQPLSARRPHRFFRADGSMPKTVELELLIPAEVGESAVVLAELRARVASEEARFAAERAKSGKRVLGRRAVRKQSWQSAPADREPRRGLRPQIAARNKWARIEAIYRNREFIETYREARKQWATDRSVAFPPGTYWLRRFANVSLTTSPS